LACGHMNPNNSYIFFIILSRMWQRNWDKNGYRIQGDWFIYEITINHLSCQEIWWGKGAELPIDNYRATARDGVYFFKRAKWRSRENINITVSITHWTEPNLLIENRKGIPNPTIKLRHGWYFPNQSKTSKNYLKIWLHKERWSP
jgi:hypothetical protein